MEESGMRPYYQDDLITLFHGDCLKVAPRVAFGDGFAVVSDPPYGVDWNTDYRRFTSGFGTPRTNHPAVRNDTTPFAPENWLGFPAVCLWGANCYSDRLPMGSWLIWDKRHKNGTAFLADAEVAWMKGGHGVYIYAQVQQGCIREDAIEHPTQKPVGLMRWCISRAAKKGETILDPFAGVGSTLVAAKSLNRKAIGIEIEERYCEIAAQRLSQEVLDFGDVA